MYDFSLMKSNIHLRNFVLIEILYIIINFTQVSKIDLNPWSGIHLENTKNVQCFKCSVHMYYLLMFYFHLFLNPTERGILIYLRTFVVVINIFVLIFGIVHPGKLT